jgi:hypothetical protein
MTRPIALSDVLGGYTARKPRPSDAVGASLRNVYGANATLPCDLTALLDRLDAVPAL